MGRDPYYLTAADVAAIAVARGLAHAEFCVEQSASQGDVAEARAELDRLLNAAANGEG